MAGGESLVELTDIPLSDTGAPCPVVYANERALVAAYCISSPAGEEPQEQSSGVIVFERVNSFVFGGPNDEALQGHRLYKIGLRFYSSYEVLNSAWIADLCARNRVHPNHKDSMFTGLRHFVFTFHDSTLEVAARAYTASVEAEKPLDCISRRLSDRQTWS
jgi:hypothetical protein